LVKVDTLVNFTFRVTISVAVGHVKGSHLTTDERRGGQSGPYTSVGGRATTTRLTPATGRAGPIGMSRT
jgi:hypothetical protein